MIRKTARPKSGGYYDIETQFLAPLPIPDATPDDRLEVGDRARELQDLHTRRRDTIAQLDQRLLSAQTMPMNPAPKEDWLWSAIGTAASWKQAPEVPPGLTGRALTVWAKDRHAAALRDRILALDTEITTLDEAIAEREAELNAIIYRLYRLTPEEITMVEGG